MVESKKFLWSVDKNGSNKAINYDVDNEKENKILRVFMRKMAQSIFAKLGNLRKYNNRLSGKISIYKMDFWSTLQIDEVHDYELANLVSSYKIKNFKIPKLRDLEMIVFDFDGVFTNNKFFLIKKEKRGCHLK